MVLALAVLVGLGLGRLLGGRVSALAAMPIRAPWLFYAAIALQVAGYPSGVLPWSIGDSLATGLWMVSYALLIAAVAVNVRLPGAAIVGLGMLSNLAAVVSNGGHMPARVSALRAAGRPLPGRAQQQRDRVASEPALADRPLAGAGLDPDGQRVLGRATS